MRIKNYVKLQINRKSGWSKYYVSLHQEFWIFPAKIHIGNCFESKFTPVLFCAIIQVSTSAKIKLINRMGFKIF